MKNKFRIALAIAIVFGVVLIPSLTANLGLLLANPRDRTEPAVEFIPRPVEHDRNADEELAYLLVKLELKTRSEIGGHLTRHQSGVPGVDGLYKQMMVKNMILPAAVAGAVFGETVPNATRGRAWVKMVVDEPRNPNNRGDETAMELLAELRGGAEVAERTTEDACYYAEPIKATAGCLGCHGEPVGEPDPYFPQYTKNGWRDGEIIGAVVSRVAPRTAD